MGLIGKIALIGIVSVAVLIAVIWDVQNENRREKTRTTSAEDLEKNLPENITTQETLNPESPQDQLPPAPDEPDESQEPVREPVPVVGPGETTPPQEQPPTEEPGPDMPEPPVPAEKYVIEKNDTLYKIAKKYYGDATLWPTIHAANLDVIPDPEVLKVGTEIIIPVREKVIRDKPIPPMPPSVETYIVYKGDTLSSISRMHYGDSSHADLIYQANRDKIVDKNILKPGTTLVIPPLPEKPK